MFSRFFIYRPIFASVIAIVIVLVGVLSIPLLPIESMPNITPPSVQVTTSYPGAGAGVVAESVTAPMEEKINGVENMIYMSSKSAADGSCNITVTFEVGVDVDMATVLVQNRVNEALPVLPEEVTRQGVKVEKQSHQHHADDQHGVTRRHFRRALHFQLHHHPYQGRAGEGQRGLQGGDIRRQGLRDADLDRPAAAARPRPHHHGSHKRLA